MQPTLNLEDLSLFMTRHIKGFDRSLCDANAARAKDAAEGGAASGALVPAEMTLVMTSVVKAIDNLGQKMDSLGSRIETTLRNEMDTKLAEQADVTDAKLATMTKGVEKVAKGVNSEMKQFRKEMDKEMKNMNKRLSGLDAQQGSSSTGKRMKLSSVETFNIDDKVHKAAFMDRVGINDDVDKETFLLPDDLIQVMIKLELIEMTVKNIREAMKRWFIHPKMFSQEVKSSKTKKSFVYRNFKLKITDAERKKLGK